MSKESGIGVTTFSIDDAAGSPVAVKNDVTALGIATPSGVQDTTGLDKSAHERLLLLADGSMNLTYVFNDAATGIFTTLRAFRTLAASQTGRTTTFVHSAMTLAMELLYSDFPLTRAADGSLTGSTTGQLSDGTVPAWSG